MSPKRLCLEPGCPNLVNRGYCKAHERKREVYRNIEREKQPGRHLYYTPRWKQLREYYLSLHPVCQYCNTAAATILDHQTPHKGDEELFWNNTFITCCSPCHARKTRLHDGWGGSKPSLKNY